MTGWVKLHRKFQNWEWYKKSEMVHLFLHLLLSANHKDNTWQGTEVKRGQLVTGRQALVRETGISERTIRTCLDRLTKTGELTSKTTNRFTIVTICNYDEYQDDDFCIVQQIDQQTTSKRPANDHKQECKEGKKKNISLDLDEFWKAYPRKVSKQQAEKAWQKLNPDSELLEKIMAALEQQKASDQWQREDGQFIPYPSTWINQKRWEDEAAKPATTSSPTYNNESLPEWARESLAALEMKN